MRLEIKNSMYKAIILDMEDRTNYTNYQSAIIEGLQISGPGGPGAKPQASQLLQSK